jgi:hypothetical protein
MLIDGTHRPWAAWTGAAVAAAAASYAIDAARSPNGAKSGSAIGIAIGIAAFAAMVFATLLSIRKRTRTWRIGRAQTWMRGHIWFGVAALPLAAFHAAGSFGGPLTRVTMWLLIVVWISGVVGTLLQNVVPRIMLDRVPMETIYEEIPRIRRQLVEEAAAIVAAAGAPATRDFYALEVHPFLESGGTASPLSEPRRAHERFEQLRLLVGDPDRAAVDDLEDIVEEQRQLSRQQRLHHLLHGWLFVHVPLSFALLALTIVHIVMALKY